MKTLWANSKAKKTDGPGSDETPPPSNGLAGALVELPILVPGGEATALEAAANERGLTVAVLARLLIRDFLGRTSGLRSPAVMIRTRYGCRHFDSKEEFISFQRACHHPSAAWVHAGYQESFVCERCWAVLDVGWPDHHP